MGRTSSIAARKGHRGATRLRSVPAIPDNFLIEQLEARRLLSGVTVAPYVDLSQQTAAVPFNDTSQWAQPWRAYLNTVPASTYLNGTSLNFNYGQGENPDLVMQQLAQHGVSRIRIEVGWGSIDYTTGQLQNTTQLQATLTACKKWGIRPLVLLNANASYPVPELTFNRTAAASTTAGATQITLTSTSGIVVGYTGISNLDSNGIAAQALVTAINGNTVTLSQPLPNAVAAGTSLQLATLKYRPFSTPGSADYNNTLAGWMSYVSTLGNFVQATLGSGKFDFEVWNELSFGSQFLNINNYYSTPQLTGDPNAVDNGILASTASYISSHFPGVGVGDGFANQQPWEAASTEPAGVTAIDKHPYPGLFPFPGTTIPGTPLNALGQPDTSGWNPNYTSYFPEYPASLIQTESLTRDLSPLLDSVYGTLHGALSGGGNMPLWITETNVLPNAAIPGMDTATIAYLKAKIALRTDLFYLNKGSTLVDLYDATDGINGFGELSDAFNTFAKTPGAVYPANDASITSPPMAALGNVAQMFSQGLDPSLTSGTTSSVMLNSLTDASSAYQFAGDGTAAHPTLYDANLFTFLPFQVNSSTFVIPYYVMTRDVTHVYQPGLTGGHQYDLPAEMFSLNLSGFNGYLSTVTAYDPINNVSVPVTVNARNINSLSVTLPATDYPYILRIQQQPIVSPQFVSASVSTFTLGSYGTFSVSTTGFPTPLLSETGLLPPGLSFVDHQDGTASIAGTPTIPGTYEVILTANNQVGLPVVQLLQLNVSAAPVPKLSLSLNGSIIAQNASASILNGTDVGQIYQGLTGAVQVFTIQDVGTASLHIRGISLSSGNFQIVGPVPTTLAPGQSGNFSLQLQTTSLGLQSSTVSLNTDDASAGIFTFSVAGLVVTVPAPLLSVLPLSGTTPMPLRAMTVFSQSVQGKPGISQAFLLSNSGDAILQIGPVTVPAGFILSVPPPSQIAPGASATMTVTCDTTIGGSFSGNVVIKTNAGQSSFQVKAVVVPTIAAAPLRPKLIQLQSVTPMIAPSAQVVGGTTSAVIPVRVKIQNTTSLHSTPTTYGSGVTVKILAIPTAASGIVDALNLKTMRLGLRLTPGQSKVINLQAVFPNVLNSGSYYLAAEIDGPNLPTDEPITLANAAAVSVAAQVRSIDVQTIAATVRLVRPGSTLPFAISLTNTGNQSVMFTSKVSAVIESVDETDQTTTPLKSAGVHISVPVKRTAKLTLPIRLPAKLKAGAYTVALTFSSSLLATGVTTLLKAITASAI